MRGSTVLVTMIALAVVVSGPVMAQTNLHEANMTFDGLLQLIQQSSAQWNSKLRAFAERLFWMLVTIQLVWKFGFMLFRQADLMEFGAELLRFIMTTGFFAALLMYSSTWSEAIVNSFRQAGGAAAGTGYQLYPGDMFGVGVKFAETISNVGMIINPVEAGVIAISAIIILLCFVFIAALMFTTLVESYIAINASVLFMGFGGSEWTRQYAIAAFRYPLAVGAKLFVLTLFVGLILTIAKEWQAGYRNNMASVLVLLGAAACCCWVCKTIPDQLYALMSGTSPGGGSPLGGMAATFAAGIAGGIAAAPAIANALGLSGGGSGLAQGVSSLLGGGGGPGSAGSNFGSGGGSGGSGGPGSGSRVGGGGTPRPGAAASMKTAGAPPNSAPAANPSPAPAAAPASSPTPTSMAHVAAAMGVKAMGTGLAAVFPGAEEAANISIPSPAAPVDSASAPVAETPENIIRPDVAQNAESPVVDTMSSVQDALNNRGKA